jgi:hypothetical protein
LASYITQAPTAVIDLTRDGWLSTYDVSVHKLSKVGFIPGKMRTHGTPSKATITNKTRPAGSFSSSLTGGPPCRPGVLCFIFSLTGLAKIGGLLMNDNFIKNLISGEVRFWMNICRMTGFYIWAYNTLNQGNLRLSKPFWINLKKITPIFVILYMLKVIIYKKTILATFPLTFGNSSSLQINLLLADISSYKKMCLITDMC